MLLLTAWRRDRWGLSLARSGRSTRPGRCGWVVERTLGRLHKFRRLPVPCERCADRDEALFTLGSLKISWNMLVHEL